ncbi:MAG: hypothetical protein J3R72DRAFT_451081 [Linnemannia gamsii]|nr:MAG: hypothetical protein J3R72DRAFT_451081 [Linnemannia gamsii]
MHSPSAILLPEVLHLIALNLEIKDLLNCRFVCHLWEKIFTPYIARSVHDRSRPWDNTPQRQHSRMGGRDAVVPTADAGNALRTAFIQKHKEHVRHIVLYDQWLLETALRIPLTQLTSLKIIAHFSQPRGFDLLPDEQLVDVPQSLFSVTTLRHPGPLTFTRTRASWQLIRNNLNLEHLWISTGARDSLFGFATKSAGVLTDEAEAFLMSTLSRLSKLRHLHLGGGGLDSIVLRRLPTDFPWITSFVFSGKAVELNELPPGFLCPTLRHLIIYATLGMKVVHRVLQVFPALLSFDLSYSYAEKGEVSNSTTAEEVIHPNIERLEASNIADLAILQLCFPKVKKVAPFRRIRDFDNLLSILRMLPGLEHLHALNVYGGLHQNDHGAGDQRRTNSKEAEIQLRTLILQNHPWYPLSMSSLLARAPHLVRLEIYYIPREAIVTIAQTCRNMEHLLFSVTQRCFKEINQVLVECSRLKSLQGKGLAIMIDDMLQGQHWTCFGLQRLQCGLMGVPRLSGDEEAFLRQKKRNSRTSDDDTEKSRILAKQQESWAIQKQVLQHLALFKDLLHLDIGFVKLPCRQHHKRFVCTADRRHHRMGNVPVPDSLELSMESGLAHLATLDRLVTFGFKEADYRIGGQEMRWMGEHWPLKRVFGFGGCIVKTEQIDNDVLEHCQAIRAIMPGVRVLERASDAA